MSKKKTFVTLQQLKEIDKTYPTPYHLYDEKGIRDNARSCLLYTSDAADE